MSRLTVATCCLTIMAYSLAVHPGYVALDPGGDQELYVAALVALQQPDFFLHDELFPFVQFSHTFFDELIGALPQPLSAAQLFGTFFWLMIFARLLLVWALYRVAFFFTASQRQALVAAALLVGGLTVYGAALQTVEAELAPRVLAHALGWAALALHLDGWMLAGSAVLIIALQMHPITALPFLIFLVLELAFRLYRRRDRTEAGSALAVVLGATVLMGAAALSAQADQLTLRLDPEWEAIFRDRISYAFLTEWSPPAWARVVASGAFVALALTAAPDVWRRAGRRRVYLSLIGIPLALSLVSFVGFDVLLWPVVAKAQLLRSLAVVRLMSALGFIIAAGPLIWAWRQRNQLVTFMAIGVLVSFWWSDALGFIFVPLFFAAWLGDRFLPLGWSRHLPLALIFGYGVGLTGLTVLARHQGLPGFVAPLAEGTALAAAATFLVAVLPVKYVQPLAIVSLAAAVLVNASAVRWYPAAMDDASVGQLCDWIQHHTRPGAVFAVDLKARISHLFRPRCRRALYTSKKDGGQVLFRERAFAIQWRERMQVMFAISRVAPASLSTRGIDYVIAARELWPDRAPVWAPGQWWVYDVTSGP